MTIVFYVVVLPFNEHIGFVQPYVDHPAMSVALALKILGFPIYLALFYFKLSFIERLLARDVFYRSWLKISLIYLLIMGVFLILLYPGHWVGDEFHILEAVRQYSLYSWQSYITNIYYTYCLYLFPSGVGIILVQLGVLSFIVGYIITLSRGLFTKNIHYYLLVPFLFFPVILNSFYPLRLTIFSYLLLLLFSLLIFLHAKILIPKSPKVLFLQASAIIAILCFWRSEGIIYILFLPLFAYQLGFLNKKSLKNKSTYFTIAGALCFMSLAFFITKATTSDKYQITATLNPLSTMIQHKLQGKNISTDLSAINKVIDLSIVKKYPSYDEIPSFWLGGIRNDYYVNLKGYNGHVYDIFLNNLDLFLENRIQVFLRTNSFGITPPLGPSQFFNTDPSAIQVVQRFYQTNILSHPINLRIKLAVTKLLLVVDSQFHTGPLTRLVWTIIPTTLALIIILVGSLIRRQWLLAFLCGLLLLHVVLIFLTAPASYFMYYFPIYLVGNFLMALLLLKYLERSETILRIKNNILNLLKTKRPLVFLLIGVLNTTLDFLFYTFLIHFVFKSPDEILVVGFISGTFALACAYTTHRFITWRDRHVTYTSVLKFFMVTGFGLWVIRPLLLSWLITFTPLYEAVHAFVAESIELTIDKYSIATTGAFLGMVLILMVYNYFMYGRLVFTRPTTEATKPSRRSSDR